MGYIYQADVYCEPCGRTIRFVLTQSGKSPADIDDESSYDSDDFPKVADWEHWEADNPQHCAECHGFGENPLTSYGYQYVLEAIAELDGTSWPSNDVLRTWAEFYGFTRDEDTGIWSSDEYRP
jgi:hypothetical protein